MAINILVLCTGNSARSIMMEGLLNALGKGRVRAFSAGSQATGRVNPLALEQLASIGIATDGFHSKSWETFARTDCEKMDIVMTVCGNAAGEACPMWPGAPLTAHWGFDDPAGIIGSEAEKREAFARIFNQIKRKVEALLAHPVETMTAQEWQRALQAIGASPSSDAWPRENCA